MFVTYVSIWQNCMDYLRKQILNDIQQIKVDIRKVADYRFKSL